MLEVYTGESELSSTFSQNCGIWGFQNKQTGEWIPFLCKGNRCKMPDCREARWRRRVRIFDCMVSEHGMNRFFTLTVDPKKFDSGKQAWLKISYLWKKFVQRLLREHEEIKYVAVLEAHKSGYPHVHGLFNQYVDLRWIRRNWQEVGGGFQCDIELVIEGAIEEYLSKNESMAKYLGKQVTDISEYLSKGQKAFWRSRGLRASFESKPIEGDWELVKGSIYDGYGNLLDIAAKGGIFNSDIVVEI